MPMFSFKDLTKVAASGLFEVFVDHWWIVDAKTGHQCLFSRDGQYWYPQCNKSEFIIRKLAKDQNYGQEVKIQQIPLAFIRRRADYSE